MLLAAVTTVLDRSDRVALLERTRAELCDAKSWHRGCFYERSRKAAERVRPTSTNTAGKMWMRCRKGKPRPSSKSGQKAANAEKYGYTATRSLKNNQRKSNDAARRLSGKCRTEAGRAE
jgi:hypothetical protein